MREIDEKERERMREMRERDIFRYLHRIEKDRKVTHSIPSVSNEGNGQILRC